MKEFIVGSALFFVFSMMLIIHSDVKMYQENKLRLKTNVEEVAASGAQYYDMKEYSEGYYVFLQEQSKKAMHSVLVNNLHLNENLQPTSKSYWKQTDKVLVESTFIDSKSGSFPGYFTFTHFGDTHNVLLFGPSVIVTINAGRPSLRLVDKISQKDVVVTGIHTFEE